MPKPEKFVFVCVNRRPPGHPKSSCSARGGVEVINKFAEIFDRKMLFGKYSVRQSGCLGPCGSGPVVTVMPDNTWYKNVTPEAAERIVEEHVENGNPVKELLFDDDLDWG